MPELRDSFGSDAIRTLSALDVSGRESMQTAEAVEKERPELFCLMLAVVSGAIAATSANIMAYSAHKARTIGQRLLRGQWISSGLLCLLLHLVGIGTQVLSAALGGAVATITPIGISSNLVVNMLLQKILGIKTYGKNSALGTVLLACAAAELSEVGPQEPKHPDVLKVLSNGPAIFWLLLLTICALGSLAGCILLRNAAVGSAPKLMFSVSTVSLTAVVCTSLGKCFGTLRGPALVVCFTLYIFLGIPYLLCNMFAFANCDVAVYIPAQLASQILLNTMTGYVIWGDANYITKPFAYILTCTSCTLLVLLIHDGNPVALEGSRLEFQTTQSVA